MTIAKKRNRFLKKIDKFNLKGISNFLYGTDLVLNSYYSIDTVNIVSVHKCEENYSIILLTDKILVLEFGVCRVIEYNLIEEVIIDHSEMFKQKHKTIEEAKLSVKILNVILRNGEREVIIFVDDLIGVYFSIIKLGIFLNKKKDNG